MTIDISATKRSKDFFVTLEEKLYSIHGDKYLFDESIYINSKTKIKVICKKHGEFYPTVTNLLNKHGCKKCGTERQSLSASFSTLDFIKKAKKVHGNKYDYSISRYKGNDTKIEIICKKHGVFTQTPHVHNSGSGCNICGSETRGASRRLFVGKKTILYYIKIQNLFKIGITRTSIKQRMYGEKYELIDSWIFNNGEEAFDIEKKILEKTKESTYDGEKIMYAGNKELRTKDIYNEIKDELCIF